MNQWIKKFQKNKIGMGALFLVLLFALLGLYAPFLASSKPFVVRWHGEWYFPFFRYLFFSGFYTKPIDLFYNILMFTLPLALGGTFLLFHFSKKRVIKWYICSCLILQIGLFVLVLSHVIKDPKSDYELFQRRERQLSKQDKNKDPLISAMTLMPTWYFELAHMNRYQKLDILIKEQMQKKRESYLSYHLKPYIEKKNIQWKAHQKSEQEQIEQLQKKIAEKKAEYDQAKEMYSKLLLQYQPMSHAFILGKHALEDGLSIPLENPVVVHSEVRNNLESARYKMEQYLQLQSKLRFMVDKRNWIAAEEKELSFLFFPLLRPFHWEENTGGDAHINKYLPWYDVMRTNRKDLAAALLFGLRISFVVGITAVTIALLVGGTLGMMAGYFAGKIDLCICRLIEIWEAMPTFFMLLLIVAITQSKSIFLVITVLGLFGWTGFARFMRAEVLKQRNLSYTMAAKALGYGHGMIMRSEILPNAIAPLLTLLPFSMMVAITSEAGLSFLGLGEEGSASLGVLMDEGRHAFPGESYLLWPAAILLSLLLIAMALVGDALRDAIDPKSS